MDPIEIVNAAAIGVNALFEIIANIKLEAGMSDDQIMEAFKSHSDSTRSAIQGYLTSLPK